MKKQLISEAAPTRVAPSISLATLVQAAMIAAIYVVLTLLANAFGLANYAIQVRFSEALTILPFFTPAAVPGLFVDVAHPGYGFRQPRNADRCIGHIRHRQNKP